MVRGHFRELGVDIYTLAIFLPLLHRRPEFGLVYTPVTPSGGMIQKIHYGAGARITHAEVWAPLEILVTSVRHEASGGCVKRQGGEWQWE